MASKLWALVKPLLPWLVAVALILFVGIWIGIQVTASQMRDDVQTANNATATVQKAFDDYKIEREKTDADKARQNQSQLQAQVNLAEHYRQQADKLSGELLAKGKALTIAQQKLREKTDELARKDGPGWTGIGPGALCLYEQNLGYSAGPGCGEYLSTANGGNAGNSGDAGRAGGGLSPRGILGHSNAYGEWCQLIRNKLNTIRQLYGKEPQ
ncbi:hypothetical protein [Klebsiella variicola]|uniref:hypothetical protein n=1 Tax=Klebsiella variicola TaxID=244366 RepID=UPI000D657384|nr:hypothetical protein [Klebsiella variicola]ELN4046271.1 hypothetical protein [Klebsiella variicola]HAH3496059.1 hypothetical protein [Escherichia coli]HEC5117449.1 hypothetical protein [Escherichia coli]